MKILCKFEKLGGITGKRIHIKRVLSICKLSEIYDDIYLDFNNKIDVLNVEDDKIQLDKFMNLMNITSNDNEVIGLIDFEEGKVKELYLINTIFLHKYLMNNFKDIKGYGGYIKYLAKGGCAFHDVFKLSKIYDDIDYIYSDMLVFPKC